MIARTWHAVVPAARGDEYLDQVRKIELPTWCLRRTEGDTAHFQILTFWDDPATVTRVAGDDYEVYSDRTFDRRLESENTIARLWRGVVPIEKGDGYLRYLLDFGFRDYQTYTGNRGVHLLRRIDDAHAHFLLLSLWSSRRAIAAYAGDDIEQAQYYPYDLDCLVDPVRTVEHYDVLQARC